MSPGRCLFTRLAFVFGLLLCSGGALAESSKTIRLTNGEWQPYLSKDVPHFGIASHIVTEAFALVGVEVEYGFFPWSRAMKLAKEGTWDGSAVWGDSEERRENFYFTEPVVPSTWVFFHLTSTQFDWNAYEDLRDIKVGGTVEYFYSDEFEAAEAAGVFQAIRARSDEVGLKNLLKGRIDVFPGDLMVTYAQIRDTFSEEEAALFAHHPKRIVEKPLYLFLSKKVPGNEQMRDLFNEGLKQLKESGKYDQIFADAFTGKYQKPK
jgi:polar amino acid transport system substrate-binding protein